MSNAVPRMLVELLRGRSGTGDERRAEVREMLDAASRGQSLAALAALGGRRLQRALWELAAGNERIATRDLVAPDSEPMRPVVFHGKNSLPAFSDFRKICCRPPAGQAEGVLWGYNDTSIRTVIGPGYFVVHDTGASDLGGTAFDYTMLPASHPPGWPDIRPNDAGLSRFIYNNTIDFMRRVAANVFIGSATRHGKEMGSYFVLFRDAPE